MRGMLSSLERRSNRNFITGILCTPVVWRWKVWERRERKDLRRWVFQKEERGRNWVAEGDKEKDGWRDWQKFKSTLSRFLIGCLGWWVGEIVRIHSFLCWLHSLPSGSLSLADHPSSGVRNVTEKQTQRKAFRKAEDLCWWRASIRTKVSGILMHQTLRFSFAHFVCLRSPLTLCHPSVLSRDTI